MNTRRNAFLTVGCLGFFASAVAHCQAQGQEAGLSSEGQRALRTLQGESGSLLTVPAITAPTALPTANQLAKAGQDEASVPSILSGKTESASKPKAGQALESPLPVSVQLGDAFASSSPVSNSPEFDTQAKTSKAITWSLFDDLPPPAGKGELGGSSVHLNDQNADIQPVTNEEVARINLSDFSQPANPATDSIPANLLLSDGDSPTLGRNETSNAVPGILAKGFDEKSETAPARAAANQIQLSDGAGTTSLRVLEFNSATPSSPVSEIVLNPIHGKEANGPTGMVNLFAVEPIRAKSPFDEDGKYSVEAMKGEMMDASSLLVQTNLDKPFRETAVQSMADSRMSHGSRGETMWALSDYTWAAPAFRHKPLYFEQPNLERFGSSPVPLYAEPVLSAAGFFGTAATMPLRIIQENPCSEVSTLGNQRPGDCATFQSRQSLIHSPLR